MKYIGYLWNSSHNMPIKINSITLILHKCFIEKWNIYAANAS